VKTKALATETITVELTEFEVTALAALVERGQLGIDLKEPDTTCIRTAISEVADEFKSLLGHFELTAS